MFYFFSVISFTIIAHPCLIRILNASPSVDDKMLTAFMKGHQEMQISKYSIQKYEAHLGIVYYMRKNWQCDKIAEEFEEYERTECQKYRKYLDILYEYLFREYVGIPTVKPKFVFKKEIEIEGPIIYAVNCLAGISQFYFNSKWNNIAGYKIKKLFFFPFELKLLNEERLNYEIKLETEQKFPINEMILQLAIDTANECQTNENLDGIMRENLEEKLKEMFIKADEREKENPSFWRFDKHFIIMGRKYNDQPNWVEDVLFSEFVKGQTTNLEKFIKLTKGNNFEKVNEDSMQQYEAHLGFSYFTKNNLQCDKIVGESREMLREECQKHRKYLQILHEYFFRLYVEGKKAEFAKKLPAVKPIFKVGDFNKSLIDALKFLNTTSKYFWKKSGNKLESDDFFITLNLENEEELNYAINEDKNWINENTEKVKQKIEIEAFRREFEQKMEKMSENEMQKWPTLKFTMRI